MLFPPFDVLAAVAPHVPDILVPAGALRSIEAFARRLPPAFDWLGFECRLGAGEDRVDFAGCCEAWCGGRDRLLAALDVDPELAGPGPAALVRAWARPDTPLAEHCPAVWLEFDFLGAGPPAPFAFLCIDPACANTFRKPPRLAPPPPPAVLCDLAARAAALLSSQDNSAALVVFRRCLDGLPLAARALHIAATPHRGVPDLRLHFALLARDLVPWLRRIDWPGEPGPVASVLALLGGEFRQVGVQLSAGDVLRPSLGLEFYVSRGPAEFTAWSRAFAALAEAGVCDPARADAVLGWWGEEALALPGERVRVRLVRQFYLKLSLTPAGLTAKAYLAVFPSYDVFGRR